MKYSVELFLNRFICTFSAIAIFLWSPFASTTMVTQTRDFIWWGLWLQVPSPEAIIGTRLAFRPPERMTPFNASRLNRFIETLGRVDWSQVNAFIAAFGLRDLITQNLAALSKKRITITGSSKITRARPNQGSRAKERRSTQPSLSSLQ